MNTVVSEFTKTHLELVENERNYEVEQSQALISGLVPTHLQRLGFALVGLRVTNTRTGLGGKTMMTLEAAVVGEPLPPTSLRSGDIVGLCAPGSHKPSKQAEKKDPAAQLSGVVTLVSESKIVVAVGGDDGEIPEDWHERCTVKKLANDITYKRIIHALKDLTAVKERPALHTVLFSDVDPRFEAGTMVDDDGFFDSSLNDSQKKAVRLAVSAHDIALIHGPPGTGKTHTIVEVIRQLAARNQRVLVCGPSNVSVDNLVERLGRIRGLPIVRLGHPARILPAAVAHSLDSQTKYSDAGELVRDVRKELDDTLAKVPKCKRSAERRALYGQIRELRKEYRVREAKVVDHTIGGSRVVLATLSGAASRDLVKNKGKFDVVVIDEATQAMEGECWIAALQAPKLILAGDHQQLPPTIKSMDARESKSKEDGDKALGSSCDLLETTLFERVRTKFGDTVCCMLTTQYRMHADIMKVSSERLYEGRLIADTSVAAHLLSDLECVTATDDTESPLVFIDTASSEMRESAESSDITDTATSNRQVKQLGDSDSKLNTGEAELTVQHVDRLIAAGVPAVDIAVISPYNAQVRLLKSMIREKYPEVEIGSVDGFQGREKEAVVLSMVRSNDTKEIGFLSDYRRINVAITRARRHLCVIGDSETVSVRDPFLKALFKHLEQAADLRYPDQV
ncbi:hypothetical protein IWW39_000751 [Coemansia spiralis]|uniref:DNA helicase n=1 Tax=Coemansia spiralis TaxID=417178 RepID=A0A9W8GLV7_9FUNG|nr:hypothetical protein IWW39_000751 [Coemansia spiralis]